MAFKKRPTKKKPEPKPQMEPHTLTRREEEALEFLKTYDGPVSADGTPYHHALRAHVKRGWARHISGHMYEITDKGRNV